METAESSLRHEGTARQQHRFDHHLAAARNRDLTFHETKRAELALWAEAAENLLTEAQAAYVQEIFTARLKPKPVSPTGPKIRAPESYVGSKPRTPKSILRRRHLARENWLDLLAGDQLTNGEAAVATVILEEIAKHGVCELFNGRIAALAGVSRTWVQHTLRILTGRTRRLVDREGKPIVVVSVEARPWKPRKHKSNLVTLHSSQEGLLGRLQRRMTWWRGRGAHLRHLLKKGQSIVGATRQRSPNSLPLSRENMIKRASSRREGLSGGESARSGPTGPMRVAPG